MSKKLLAGSLAGAVGIVALVFSPLESKPIYALGVRDFLARDMRDREARVEGRLVHGSLCREEEACGYRFTLADLFDGADAGAQVPSSRAMLSVHYEGCVLPDTFRDIPGLDFAITVQGERCQTCHDFAATQVIAKCPGKYELRVDGGPQSMAPPIPRCDALEPRM